MNKSTILRASYLPAMAGMATAAVAAAHQQRWLFVAVAVMVAIGWNRLAEYVAPYEVQWNRTRGDRSRDVLHAVANESLTIVALLIAPVFTGRLPWEARWPSELPFAIEVTFAVIVADIGITVAHVASHRVRSLWRLHAVHHSATRLYGFNGLMKHPLHQSIETLAGVAPLLLLAVPTPVGAALGAVVVIQLNVQHSNATYLAGALHRWCAFNQGHRLHHRNRVPDGDVNFGLFLLVWDRILHTYAAPASGAVRDGAVGLAGVADYPTQWFAQLREPFLHRRSAT